MRTLLHVPGPAVTVDLRRRSDMLVEVIERLLTTVLHANGLLLAQVASPLLLDGPVVVERGSAATTTTCSSALTVLRKHIPGGLHVPPGHLVLAASDEQALAECRLLPLLLSSVMDAQVQQQVAENATRGALEIANRDPATGLGNRRAWLQSLRVEASRAQRTGRPLTVLVVDLDGLKAVNDAQGHAAGDELIVRAAHALVMARRATDEVCRLGGDEFGLIAPDTDGEQAASLVERVRRVLVSQGVVASVGLAVGAGEVSIDELWQCADAAMYDDKRSRRG